MLCCLCCLKHYIYIANPSGKLSRPLLIRSKDMSFMYTTECRGRCGMGAATFHCGSLHASSRRIFTRGVRVFWVTCERNFSHEDDDILYPSKSDFLWSPEHPENPANPITPNVMFVTLTLNEIINNYKSVDEIQWCYNSNKTLLAKLLNCTIHFWELYNKKIIWIFLCDECFRSKPTHHSCLVFSYRSHLYSIFCIQRSPTFPWWSGDS